MTTYRDLHDELPNELALLLNRGTRVPSRDGVTLELRHHAVTLERPWERFLFHPARRDDPIAKVAETVWLLAGRNDVNWLAEYLPRAPQFSDDGQVWRAGYGPRMRAWPAAQPGDPTVDQLARVYRELATNPESRRASIVLADPARDWVNTKDIPCNQVLHFLVRDEQLHLAVTVRSQDYWWGRTGINAFAFSTLQELLARWLDVGIGQYTTFASSWHLYERHWDAALKLLEAPPAPNPYVATSVRPSHAAARHLPIDLTPITLDRELSTFFTLEEAIRTPPRYGFNFEELNSVWLRTIARMLFVAQALKRGEPPLELRDTVAAHMPPSDFRLATERLLDARTARLSASSAMRSTESLQEDPQ